MESVWSYTILTQSYTKLGRTPAVAFLEDVFKARSQHFRNHHIVVRIGANPIYPRDPWNLLESLVNFRLVHKPGMPGVQPLQFDGDAFVLFSV